MATLFLDPKFVPAGTPLPSNAQDLINFVSQFTGIGGLAGFVGINIGNSTPNVEDRDKPWFKLNADGFTLGWHYFVDGIWRPERPIGTIEPLGHDIVTAPIGFKICNGVGTYTDEDGNIHPVPDYRDVKPVGAGLLYAVGETGGNDSVTASFNLPATSGPIFLGANNIPSLTGNLNVGLSDDASPPTSSRLGRGNAVTQNDVGNFPVDIPGAGQSFTAPIAGTVGGPIDVRDKFLASHFLIWTAA